MPPTPPVKTGWHWFLALCLAFSSLCFQPRVAAASADESRKHYDVPAGDAIDTLKRFAQQAGREIVYPAEQVRGVQTHAVSGDLTVVEALECMLADTGLKGHLDEPTGAISVTREADPPVEKKAEAGPGNTGRPADEIVHLPSFKVSGERDDSLVGKQALSTTRTGIELLNLPQSVKVINREFIDTMNPGLVADTLKYVGGGQAGNINFADDRFTLRGFNSPANIGDFVDGFRGTTDSNTDPAIIERLEIIKGPSAIFVANGPVGGVINKIIKGPVDYELHTLKVQVGAFDSDRVELDTGGPITADKKLLYRVVAAGQYSDGWYDNTYTHRLIFAPSFAYAFSANSLLTVKYNYFIYRFASYNGLPFDERTGRRIDVARDSTFSENAPLNWRKDIVHRGIVEYTNRFNDYLAMRVAGFYSYNDAARVESVYGGDIPLAYVPGTKLARSTTAQDQVHLRRQIQTDFVATFPTGPIEHRLLFGGEWADAPDLVQSFPGSSSSIDPFDLQFPGTVTVGANPSSDLRTNNHQLKGFALETASLFHGKLMLSGGVSRIEAFTSSRNLLTSTSTAKLSLGQNLKQYGAVFKVMPGVSLFYGYNENFAPNFLNGLVLPSQVGQQNEFGVKTDLLDGRLQVNVSYFDLKQENVPVPAFPQTTPPSYILVPGETSKGIDGDITFKATSQLYFVVSFADLDAKARSQANTTAPVIVQPVNNVAEQTFGLWTRYKFTSGSLRGFAVSVGVSHLAKRAIANNANSVIYGWLDPFTTVDLAATYDVGHFRYGLNIDNLFNAKYDAAVRNQSIIVPGTPINVKASIMWKF